MPKRDISSPASTRFKRRISNARNAAAVTTERPSAIGTAKYRASKPVSAGTSIGEKGRSRSSLALRPFTYGRYELYKNRESYNINSAEVLKSYYRIGEDVDKYMNGAYVLEFTEKILSAMTSSMS